MNYEQLNNIINHHYRELRKYIRKIVKDFGVEDIHQFRVVFKKLRALLRMLYQQRKADVKSNIPKKLRKCYNILGKIREVQLQQQQIQEVIQQDTIMPIQYLRLLKKQIDDLKPRLFKICSKNPVPESKGETSGLVPDSFLLKEVNNFKKEKWSAVYAIIRSGDFSNDNMHTIRKNLKDLYYNLNMYEAAENRLLSFGIGKVKGAARIIQLLDDLGNLQNKRIAIGLLKPGFIQKIDTHQRAQLERIKKRWIIEKLRMKQSLVKQLTTEFAPLRSRHSDSKLLNIT